MDLVSFRNSRALRRAEAADADVLQLENRFGDQAVPRLVPRLRALDWRPRRNYDPREQARQESFTYMNSPEAITEAMLAAMYAGPAVVTQPSDAPGRTKALAALVALDRILTARENQPEPKQFERDVQDALAIGGLELGDRAWFGDIFGQLWADLVDTLVGSLIMGEDGRVTGRLTRLLLVGGVLLDRASRGQPFAEAKDIRALLRFRYALLPADLIPRLLRGRSTRLVREATVSDLYVVRSEWRCFVPGEICDIRNVMAHETLDVRTVQIDERQTVTGRTEQTFASQQEESRSTTKSDMSDETQRQMALAVQAQAQVNVSAQYGTAKIDAAAGVGVNFSLQDNNSRAMQLSREVVARSVSTVETNVRIERRDTTLTHYKQSFQHAFQNNTEANATGIYRWVDRIDRYQVFRYPDRLQLEFQLPEPGKYLRSRLASANVPLSVKKPPDFYITPDSFRPDNYASLAAEFRAAGIEAPPQEELAVSGVINAAATGPQPSNWNQRFDAPAAADKLELILPPGYLAKSAQIKGKAIPVLGNWNAENGQNLTFGPFAGFRTMVVTASLAGQVFSATQAGSGNRNTVQLSFDRTKNLEYLDAVCEFSFDEIALSSLTQKIPVALHAAGAESVTATVRVVCVPSEETIRSWRQTAFNACLAAWETWNSDYEAARAQSGGQGGPIAERSPARNGEMILDEIKRQVIAWLLGESPFQGRPALLPDSIDTDISRALEAAPDVQFLEQAFEWINVNYVPYPYYWAARRRDQNGDHAWDDLIALETADANLGRFLRAGSVRVVVPVRPGFTESMMYYLLFGKPWEGGPPPIPGDSDHLSVAAEIRDMLTPPEDGEPLDSWEARLPTTFQWLDPSPNLPHNTTAALGAPPHEPKRVLCPGA